jgi:exopolysaccharide biosynthesis predicted pyruvyltransferase EpsI
MLCHNAHSNTAVRHMLPANYPHLVSATLQKYRAKKLFFDPLDFGNNGDKIIELGTRSLFESIGITPVRKRATADVIVLNGGGAMSDLYTGGIAAVEEANRKYGHIPLIVLPQSYYFERTEFPRLFRGRSAPVTLFARERQSYARLSAMRFPCRMEVTLDHDMALALVGGTFLSRLSETKKDKHVLLVERADIERVPITAPPSNRVQVPAALKALLPLPLKRQVRWYSGGRRAIWSGGPTPFRRRVLQALSEHFRNVSDYPVLTADVSTNDRYTFSQFTSWIADAAAVATTRLHVGVLSALLGKPTLLVVGGGAYRKVASVYEYSLRALANVAIVEL